MHKTNMNISKVKLPACQWMDKDLSPLDFRIYAGELPAICRHVLRQIGTPQQGIPQLLLTSACFYVSYDLCAFIVCYGHPSLR